MSLVKKSHPSRAVTKYLSTHPAMDERIEALQAETRKAAEPRAPLMTLDEWKLARAVCGAN